MPQIGDTKTLFGRTYVYTNPDQALGPGTWRLADHPEGAPSTGESAASLVYGQATVAEDGSVIKKGMLVRLDGTGKAYPALASSEDTSRVVGVAIDQVTTGQVVRFTTNTSFDMFNADTITDEGNLQLEIGRPYYLSAINPGFWTLNPRSDQHPYVVLQCGIAVDQNYMAVDIQALDTES